MSRSALSALLAEELAPRRLARPAALSILAFTIGAGLLALAGWFIAASALAGLTIGSTFSFLFPSAGVQALAWSRALSRYGERISTHRATLDLLGSLRTRLFARALELPRDRAAAFRSGDLLGRITADSDAVENLLLGAVFPGLVALASFVLAALVFWLLSPWLALIVLPALALSGAVLITLTGRRADGPARTLVAARAQARRAVIETAEGLPELRSYGAEERAADEVAGHLDRLASGRRQLDVRQAGARSIGTLLTDLTLLAAVATAAGLIGGQRLSAPWFAVACLVTLAVCEPLLAIPAALAARARARAAAVRLGDLFPEAPPSPGAAGPAGATAAIAEHLRPGSTVLLTGPSGSGKSTILRELASDGGADEVTLVAQDAYVFDGTLRENLQLACPGASEARMWAALGAAALDDVVRDLPAGLDTPVGPGGSALSGGQRRRLSVAMGVLRAAPVLLLDEPTEGLDASCAVRLLAGVRALDSSTAIVIALHDRQTLTLPWALAAHVELGSRAAIDCVARALSERQPIV